MWRGGADIPVSVTVVNTHYSSVFTTPINQAGDALFANLPKVILSSSESQLVLEWGTVLNRLYDVEWSSNLTSWDRLTDDLPGTGADLFHTNFPVADDRRFFRINVHE